jgi:sialic acid synthase SpsE
MKIGDNVISSIILGTSPFYSFIQFGERNAKRYGKKFSKAENIAHIILRSIELGIDCIQTVSPEIKDEPYYSKISFGKPPLVEAIQIAQKKLGRNISSISTIITKKSLNMLKDLDNVALLIDGNVIDNTQKIGISYNKNLNIDHILSLKNAVLENTDSAFGFVTHCPGTTIPKLMGLGGFWDEVDVLLTPINRIGYRIRPKWDNRCVKALENAKNTGVQVLGMKILASGRILPREALEYVASLEYIDGVVLGVASVEEVEQTFSIAFDVWKNRSILHECVSS